MGLKTLKHVTAPGGAPLTVQEDKLVAADGRSYDVLNGTPHLYDKSAVSPFLAKDYDIFKTIHERPDLRSPNHDEITALYQRAKYVNTEFMFSALKYKDLEQRAVVEIGVGSADLIKRWADLAGHAYAVDFFTWEMEAGLAKHVAAGGKPFHGVSAVMAALPFANEAIDIVYLHAALHHALPADSAEFEWSNPSVMVDCLKEVRRILKPDGVFFLTGEGIYPEGIALDEREHEVRCQAHPGYPYEAHYTITEYESAFRAADMFPHVFVHQEGYQLAMDFYVDGKAHSIISAADKVSNDNYDRVGSLVKARTSKDLLKRFPAWMSWRSQDQGFSLSKLAKRLFRA